jgi:hypothetical protein
MHFYKKLLQYLIFSATLAVFFLSGANVFAAPTATYQVTGYAWGGEDGTNPAFGGIGWIKFDNVVSGTPYGVTLDGDGNFNGYAWSGGSNTAVPGGIGWISFNPLDTVGCPTAPCAPTVAVTKDMVTGEINGGTGVGSGWARACAVFEAGTPCHDIGGNLRPASETGGWDGWIRLGSSGGFGGVTFNTSSLKFSATSYMHGGNSAAGNNDIGWVGKLDGLTFTPIVPPPPPPSLTFTIDSNSILIGATTVLRWSNLPPASATSCTGSNGVPPPSGWAGAKSFPNGSQVVGPFAAPASYTYILQCTGPGGPSTPLSQTLTVTAPPPIPGVCGSADGVPSRQSPAGASLCGDGSTPPVTPDTSVTPNLWRWTCPGQNGGASASCSAPIKKGFLFWEF